MQKRAETRSYIQEDKKNYRDIPLRFIVLLLFLFVGLFVFKLIEAHLILSDLKLADIFQWHMEVILFGGTAQRDSKHGMRGVYVCVFFYMERPF